MLVRKVHGVEDPVTIYAAYLLYAWLRAAGKIRIDDLDGMVLEVPIDLDVCNYIRQMPKINRIVNPREYICVRKVCYMKVYYGKILIAELFYRDELHHRVITTRKT